MILLLIPVSRGIINIVYSSQLMQHSYLDEVCIYRTLHRLPSSYDISDCYDETTTGFHFQEDLTTTVKPPLTPTITKLIELSQHILLKLLFAV